MFTSQIPIKPQFPPTVSAKCALKHYLGLKVQGNNLIIKPFALEYTLYKQKK